MRSRREAAAEAVAPKVRAIHAEILRLCPSDTRRNVRISPPEPRDNYALIRASNVDALDVSRLVSRFPTICVYVRDSDSGACLDIYVPYSEALLYRLFTLASALLYLVAAGGLCMVARTLLVPT